MPTATEETTRRAPVTPNLRPLDPPDPVPLRIQLAMRGDHATFVLQGMLDCDTTALVTARVRQAIYAGCRDLTFECEDVECTHDGVTCLIGAFRRLHRTGGGSVRVLHPRGRLAELIARMQLWRLFEVTD
jgi:hypothetical protein